MSIWPPLTERVFKSVALKGQTQRECLHDGQGDPLPPCPGGCEAAVNALSATLRGGERVRNLATLAVQLDRLRATVVRREAAQILLEEIETVVDRVVVEQRPAFDPEHRASFCGALKEAVGEKVRGADSVGILANALWAFCRDKNGDEPRLDDEDIFTALDLRKEDHRSIIRLAGIARKQEDDPQHYIESVQDLWLRARAAKGANGWADGFTWDEFVLRTAQLHAMVIKEIERTVKAGCRFLKKAGKNGKNSKARSLCDSLSKFPLKKASKHVWAPESHRAKDGSLREPSR